MMPKTFKPPQPRSASEVSFPRIPSAAVSVRVAIQVAPSFKSPIASDIDHALTFHCVATPKKKVIDEDEQKFKPEPLEDEDELLNTKAKRAKATPKPKTKANGTIKKEIIDADDEDAFFDASEQPEVDIKDLADAAGEQVRNERKFTLTTPSSSHISSAFTSKFLQHRAEQLGETADSDYLSDGFV
jgi:hypothetical protein